MGMRDRVGVLAAMDLDVSTSREEALLDMMKVNISIHTLFYDHYNQHDLSRRSVIPYLETNRFRPRVRAIQKTLPITKRAMVLGRALLSARTDANSFRMILSENAEVAFPSRIAAAALSLPTPATAAVTFTTDIAYRRCCFRRSCHDCRSPCGCCGCDYRYKRDYSFYCFECLSLCPSSGQKRKARP